MLVGLNEGPFEQMISYTEVVQDGMLDMLDSGKLTAASATAFSVSPEGQIRFNKSIDRYRKQIILRPQEISNHPEIIRRLGCIAMNTPVEIDIYAHANSTLVGGTRREINIYLKPQTMEAFGVAAEQVVAAVRGENQNLPVGAIRSLTQERIVQIDARMKRPEDFQDIIVARKGNAPIRLGQLAEVRDGAQELDLVVGMHSGDPGYHRYLNEWEGLGDQEMSIAKGARKPAWSA